MGKPTISFSIPEPEKLTCKKKYFLENFAQTVHHNMERLEEGEDIVITDFESAEYFVAFERAMVKRIGRDKPEEASYLRIADEKMLKYTIRRLAK